MNRTGVDETDMNEKNIMENRKVGPLIADDYLEARRNLKDVIIVPFDKGKAKGTGYNLSPCTLFYSKNKKRLIRVHQNEKEVFVWVEPHDTVLTISKEYIITPKNMVGTIHSRVRMSADGLGNVSTTLDPNWKGKLLLAINNPTKKKVKLRIEEKSEGKTKSIALVTMVLSWIGKGNDESDETSLHLDNPPMRTDIWKDLSEKPGGIRASEYERFQDIIQKVTEFKVDKSERYDNLQKLIDSVNEVRRSITRKDPLCKVQSLTVGFEESLLQKRGDEELKNKFLAWNDAIKNASTLEDLSENKIGEKENAVIRECRYLMMCDEIEQHDNYICKQIDQYWEGGDFARFFKKWIFPNLTAIVAFLIIFAILFWGKNDYSLKVKIVLSLITPIMTTIMQWINIKFNK